MIFITSSSAPEKSLRAQAVICGGASRAGHQLHQRLTVSVTQALAYTNLRAQGMGWENASQVLYGKTQG